MLCVIASSRSSSRHGGKRWPPIAATGRRSGAAGRFISRTDNFTPQLINSLKAPLILADPIFIA
jgi:hypothetical protein